MGAAELLLQLRANGFAVTASGTTVYVAPRESLTDDLRSDIRAVKPELLRILLGERLAIAINSATLARGDTEEQRQALLAEALALPPHQQADLSEHFEDVARIWQAAFKGACA